MIHYNPEFSGSVTGTQATVSLSGSFTGSGHIERANTASKLTFSASFGLGIENTFDFDGSSNQIINIDTASGHFISGAIAALNDNTGSFLTTSSISDFTMSFTKADNTTYDLLLPTSSDTASKVEFDITNGLGIDSFTYNGSQTASVQLDTSSVHYNLPINNATASVVISAETSSIRPIDTIVFIQGDSSSFTITQDTSSFVLSVNGRFPDATTGNVSTTLTAVDTGTSASMLAKSSSGNMDNGEVWIISGESGSLTGSNGEAYIFDSGSGQLFEISNLDQPENDARYVLKTGDTMTGNLILNSDPTLALQATTKQYVDPSFITASVSTGSDGSHTLTFARLGGGTDVISLASSSFTLTASFANKVSQSLTQGLGVETFSYNGSTSQTVQVDTASFHIANLTASLVSTASISGLTQSFTKGDGSTFEINLPDTGAVDLAFEITGGLGIEPFTFDNTADATVQVNTASFHVANLTASLLTTASVANTTMSFTKGDASTFEIYITESVTASYALTASVTTGTTYKENVTGATTYTITHNLGEQYPIVQSYDTATNVMVIPSEVTASSANALDIKFASAFTGIVVVQR